MLNRPSNISSVVNYFFDEGELQTLNNLLDSGKQKQNQKIIKYREITQRLGKDPLPHLFLGFSEDENANLGSIQDRPKIRIGDTTLNTEYTDSGVPKKVDNMISAWSRHIVTRFSLSPEDARVLGIVSFLEYSCINILDSNVEEQLFGASPTAGLINRTKKYYLDYLKDRLPNLYFSKNMSTNYSYFFVIYKRLNTGKHLTSQP